MNRGRRHFPGAVSTPHHAPSGEPSVALVAQKTRCGQGGQGRAVPSPGLPCRRPEQEAARRNPAQAVPDRRLYRPRPAYSSGTRTPYAPGAPAQSRTVTRFAVPATRAGGRRAGTLPRPCLTDACTVHDRRTQAAPVPPTRRGRRGRRGERQAATQATPNSPHRPRAASQSPDERALPSRDRRRRRRYPRRHAGHVLPGQTTDADPPTVR